MARRRLTAARKNGDDHVSDETETGSLRWRGRQPLSGTDLMDFLALRRVCGHPGGSRVRQVADQYVDNERPVLPFLADGLAALVEVGHLALGEPDPSCGGTCPVLVTASGRARYEHLCDRQGVPAYSTARVLAGEGE